MPSLVVSSAPAQISSGSWDDGPVIYALIMTFVRTQVYWDRKRNREKERQSSES